MAGQTLAKGAIEDGNGAHKVLLAFLQPVEGRANDAFQTVVTQIIDVDEDVVKKFSIIAKIVIDEGCAQL